ncbi:Panacea domain-containing protein [Phaeovulum sp.]|uniref:Panacea domain-containing protein n=1 Tax=Phaeovulum sp. TaxID=2934796 RepID=UPI00273189E0|nr:Panacea domain-containing protein [Phaeovulum sp.]MDP1669836.1 Panacea domain-containing protein [Phaeovulum sp.]MDZ4118754.1 Panacea domain-containing protein [Phaeovulum sp.]
MIRFTFSPLKATGAVTWMLSRSAQLDLHTILKAAYFADKHALNEQGRPVFGATYRAMNYGPVPLEIYEMLKGEPLWLPEIGRDDYPWERQGHFITRKTDQPINLDHLSEMDLAALETGYERSRGLTFDERTQATHGSDWTKAYPGTMAYEDMIDPDRPDRVGLLRELERLGPHLVL